MFTGRMAGQRQRVAGSMNFRPGFTAWRSIKSRGGEAFVIWARAARGVTGGRTDDMSSFLNASSCARVGATASLICRRELRRLAAGFGCFCVGLSTHSSNCSSRSSTYRSMLHSSPFSCNIAARDEASTCESKSAAFVGGMSSAAAIESKADGESMRVLSTKASMLGESKSATAVKAREWAGSPRR